jgi:ABC-type uncharacterized transport system ATPase subunit
LDFANRPLAEQMAFVQDRDFAGDLPHKRHVVIDDEQRVFSSHGEEQFAGPLGEIKQGREFSIQLDYDGDGRVLQQLPGAIRVNDHGKQAEIFLQHGDDPQLALRWLIERITIRRFEYRAPTLHEIFVRTVESANQKLANKASTEGAR